MKSRYYKVTLTTVGPLFIGAGMKLTKKECIFDKNKKKVYVPNFAKMYLDIKKNRHERDFREFIVNGKGDLYFWLKDYKYTERDFSKWTMYTLDCGDAVLDKGRLSDIDCYIKDPYGLPYVPGSSLKGMLRTILLAYDIKCNEEIYENYKRMIESGVQRGDNRARLLMRETRELEAESFHTLNRPKTNKPDMVNDIMARVIVGDSKPLSADSLVLCQKVDMHRNGEKKPLPILRECIQPGIKIEFELEIGDETGFTAELIMAAIESFATRYNSRVISKYQGMAKPKRNNVWLGGGAGFHTKTIINAIFAKENEALSATDKILQGTLGKNYFTHKHNRDVRLGSAPHVLKVTKYCGKIYQMGHASFEIEEHLEKLI